MATAIAAAIGGTLFGKAVKAISGDGKKDGDPATPVMAADQQNAAGSSSNAKKYLLSQNPSAGYGSNSMNTAKSFLLSY